MFTYAIAGAASLALLGVFSTATSASPAGAAAARTAVEQTSAVETVAYRRCQWRNGVRHCARVRPDADFYGYQDYSYGRPRPEAFPTGSTAWWRAMDYEGRGGHGRGGR